MHTLCGCYWFLIVHALIVHFLFIPSWDISINYCVYTGRRCLLSAFFLIYIYIYIHTKAFFVHLLYTLFFAPGTSRPTTAFTLAGGDLVSPYFQTSSYLFLTSILLDKA